MTLWEMGLKRSTFLNVVRELSFPEYGGVFVSHAVMVDQRAVQCGGNINLNLLWHWQVCTVRLWLFSDPLQ
jgi:hypothetical protein